MDGYRITTEPFDEALSMELTCRRFAARGLLLSEMERQGLLAEQGWRVAEETRFVQSCSQIVFRPFHPQLPSPGLECVALIDEYGGEFRGFSEPEWEGIVPIE
jgi:hypothetical protein